MSENFFPSTGFYFVFSRAERFLLSPSVVYCLNSEDKQGGKKSKAFSLQSKTHSEESLGGITRRNQSEESSRPLSLRINLKNHKEESFGVHLVESLGGITQRSHSEESLRGVIQRNHSEESIREVIEAALSED